MRICITLDDVIRAKTKAFGEVYKKHINREIDLNNVEITSNDLSKVFKFKSKKSYQDFLYKDFTDKIFGQAQVCEKMLDKILNLWLLHLENCEEIEVPIEVMIANPMEFNTTIGHTFYFLHNIATRIREFFFPKDSSEIIDKCDILITSDPKLLNKNIKGKTFIKIKMPYNEHCECDYEFDKLSDLINDISKIVTIIHKHDN